MSSYLLAHDLGTSGNKATLYREDGLLVASALASYPTFYPERSGQTGVGAGAGAVEQDSADWWRAVCQSTGQLLERSGIDAHDIAAVSFSGQMMGCLPVDATGRPLRNSIIWADTRARLQEQQMQAAFDQRAAYRIVGHRTSASYSAAKLRWVKDNEPAVYARCAKMLNAKDYIVYQLTGQFASDYSDASGTNLFDLTAHRWSDELVAAYGLDKGKLPDLHASTEVIGQVSPAAAALTGLVAGTPVVMGAGDGSAACVGAGVVRPGKAYAILGSSSWISMAAAQPVFDEQLRTFNWAHCDPDLYTPCGTMQAAGYSYQWFVDSLCRPDQRPDQDPAAQADPYEELNRLVESVAAGSDGLLFLPYLLGERSPRWDADARGAFVGLSSISSRASLARSVLEGVGFNLKVILDIFRQSAALDGPAATRPTLNSLTLIGGGATSPVWRQILADIWSCELAVPAHPKESTSLGAAICAGIGVGLYPDFTVAERWASAQVQTTEPQAANQQRYERLFDVFNQAYEALRPVYRALAAYREGH